MSEHITPFHGAMPTTPPDMAAAATRTVCAHSDDADQASMLLQMLGLIPTTARVAPAPEVVLATCVGEGCEKLTRPRGTAPLPTVPTVTRYGRGLCRTCRDIASLKETA